MTIHREGYKIVSIALLSILIIIVGIFFFLPIFLWLKLSISIILLVIFFLILQFFRSPNRRICKNSNIVLSPADGKIVVIEEVFEPEYFKDKRLQVSIFMSPFNVHQNRYPISGKVLFSKYHPGKYLVAWHPKSSTENERTTVVIEDEASRKVLFRQIAGAVARRIVNYAKEGETIEQGQEMGFIKFGSRVDIFLPLQSKILVQLNNKVKGGISQIARFD